MPFEVCSNKINENKQNENNVANSNNRRVKTKSILHANSFAPW